MSAVSARLRKAILAAYSPGDAQRVIDAIEKDPDEERVQCAAVKAGSGSLERFLYYWDMAKTDFRDTLVAAGFDSDPKEHLRWLDHV
jgi:hypothetical protein